MTAETSSRILSHVNRQLYRLHDIVDNSCCCKRRDRPEVLVPVKLLDRSVLHATQQQQCRWQAGRKLTLHGNERHLQRGRIAVRETATERTAVSSNDGGE